MDRYAIFIDAGYAYAAGGELVLDASNRAQVAIDHGAFIATVRDRISAEFPNSGDFLRVYWYDAAPRGVPQPEHETIAALPGVKIRLGRLTRQGQKGVDALVLRDMMRLSAEHAICTAFLVSGDEDLRQGVIEAQDYGVRVILFGIEATIGQNLAQSLIDETDDLRVLTYDELQHCFSTATSNAPVATIGGLDAYQVGFDFGRDFLPRVDADEAASLSLSSWLPPEINNELIQRVLDAGDLPRGARLPEGAVYQARDGFRAALRAQADTAASNVVEESSSVSVRAPETRSETGPSIQAEANTVSAPDTLSPDQVWAYTEGGAFGRTWIAEQPENEIRFIRNNFPSLPSDVDRALLVHLVREMGLPYGSRIDDRDRKAARAGFWSALGMELEIGPVHPTATGRFEPIDESDPTMFGVRFARQWADRSSPGDVESARVLLERRIGLPSEADRLLLRMAASCFGDPVPVDIRHRLRDGFRLGLESPK